MATKYVAPISNDGWLVVLDRNNQRISLPQYLKVDTTGTNGDRTNFTITEGILKDKACSVKTMVSGNQALIHGSHDAAAGVSVTFYKSTAFDRNGFKLIRGDLSCRGQSSGLPVVTLEGNPPPVGQSDLEIPDAPHRGGLSYSAHATTWFRIGHSGDRYLHTGRYSAGCITVDSEVSPSAWEDVYRYLIRRRKDLRSVGIVDVTLKD